MTVDKQKPGLHRYIHDSNLLRQYDLLKDCVLVALNYNTYCPDEKLLKNLNQAATANLCEYAGQYRSHEVEISNSPHTPPSQLSVPGLVHEFIQDVEEYWPEQSATWLAAFCLWRINWIHPFADGNGRTARAVSYFVLCTKYGMWLPGKQIIPHQIRNNRSPYYEALKAADSAYKNRDIDVSALQKYLEGLLEIQLTNIEDSI